MGLGISFNGSQFVYRDFKYDRLADAIAYAEVDVEREGKAPAATTAADWLAPPLPGLADQAEMQEHGIVFENRRYKYLDYRYDRLADALNYARKDRS